MSVRDTLTALAGKLRYDNLHGYASVLEAAVAVLEHEERRNALTRHPDIAGFGSANARPAEDKSWADRIDEGAARIRAEREVCYEPTMELRFRVQPDPGFDMGVTNTRNLRILQQKWQLTRTLTDTLPLFDWRDVPLVDQAP